MTIEFNSYSKEYGWMSNMSKHPITDDDGNIWASVEHYYQAAKTNDIKMKQRIFDSDDPFIAKQLSKEIKMTLRQQHQWNLRRVSIMDDALRMKFEQHPDLADKLLATGNEDLIHLASWDLFWGSTPRNNRYIGSNTLGILLMAIRDDLKEMAE